MFDTKPYEQKFAAAVAHFEDELKKIRTGRAHPDMLDGILVDVYGARMPLNQVATITAPEPQQILVTPFDMNNVAPVTQAIRADQTLGFNPSDDGRNVRVPIPPLTEERRLQIVKQLNEKVEECKIALRNVREEARKKAKVMKDAKELGADDVHRVEKLIDDAMNDAQADLEKIAADKEKEILTI